MARIAFNPSVALLDLIGHKGVGLFFTSVPSREALKKPQFMVQRCYTHSLY